MFQISSFEISASRTGLRIFPLRLWGSLCVEIFRREKNDVKLFFFFFLDND